MGIKLRPVIAVPSDMAMMGVQTLVDSTGQPELFYQASSSRPPAAIYRQYQAIYGDKARWKGVHRLPDGTTEYWFQLHINSGASLVNTAFTIDDKANQEDFDRAGKQFTARTVMHIWVELLPEQVKAYQATHVDHDSLWVPMPTYDTPLSPRDVAANAVQRSIQAIYEEQNAAAARLDPAGAFTGCAPDFVSLDLSGRRLTLAQERQVVRQIFATLRAYMGKTTIQKITVTGDIAVVRIVDYSISTFTDPRTSKEAQLVDDSTSLNVWKKTGQRWLLTRSKRLSEHATKG